MPESDEALRALVAEIAAAYFTSSHVTAAEIPTIIGQIATSLSGVGGAGGAGGTGLSRADAGPDPQIHHARRPHQL